MQYVLTIGLTLIASWSIIKIAAKTKKKRIAKTMYSQSDMHRMLKIFFLREMPNDKEVTSQLMKRKEKDTLKVIIVEDRAYWVADNIFYVSDAKNGTPQKSTAKPVDTTEMSKKDIEKMLFILDNLKNGKVNDSGSAGNERF